MATVYILFSKKFDRYYVGSCLNLDERIADHKSKKYQNSYTCDADDWELFYKLVDLGYRQAREIEKHIKKMKSRSYIENLKKYNEISIKLLELYKNDTN